MTVGNQDPVKDLLLAALAEETGYALAPHAQMRPVGTFYSLPSETNKYTHVFLATLVSSSGPAIKDTEIEKYFDMSVVLIPVEDALHAVGSTITGMETVGALLAARPSISTPSKRTDGHAVT